MFRIGQAAFVLLALITRPPGGSVSTTMHDRVRGGAGEPVRPAATVDIGRRGCLGHRGPGVWRPDRRPAESAGLQPLAETGVHRGPSIVRENRSGRDDLGADDLALDGVLIDYLAGDDLAGDLVGRAGADRPREAVGGRFLRCGGRARAGRFRRNGPRPRREPAGRRCRCLYGLEPRRRGRSRGDVRPRTAHRRGPGVHKGQWRLPHQRRRSHTAPVAGQIEPGDVHSGRLHAPVRRLRPAVGCRTSRLGRADEPAVAGGRLGHGRRSVPWRWPGSPGNR